jgi:drug/metabolite transporter (DMT)-like permease
VVVAAMLWSMLGTAYALFERHLAVDALTIVTIRALSAAVMVLGWLAFTNRRAMRIARTDLPRFVVYGLVSVTIFYPMLIYAFRYTSVAVGTLLLYLAPAIVAGGAVLLLGEALSVRKVVALATALTGCALVVRIYEPSAVSANELGLALGIGSAICYACLSLIGKPLVGRYPVATVTVWYLMVGAIGLLGVRLVIAGAAWPSLSGGFIIALSCGLFMTALPALFYARGLSGLHSSDASIVAMVEPVLAMGWATAILGERLSWPQLFGALLVLSSVVLLAVRGRTRGRIKPLPEPLSP